MGFLLVLGVVGALALQLSATTVSRFKEARLEERVLLEIDAWSAGQSVEVQRLDVQQRHSRPLLELWLIVDVPLASGKVLAAPAELIPPQLRGDTLRQRLRDLLGPEFDVSLRVQVRFAGLIDLRSGTETDAPDVSESDDPGG